MSKNITNARIFQGVKHLLPNYIVKSGSGSYIYTECGKKLLDFSCGIGVTNLGHCHPTITLAAQKAVGEIVHAQQNIMRHENLVKLSNRLANLELSKKSNFDSWFFWNSGAEAVEAAVKLARQVIITIIIINFYFKYFYFCFNRQLINQMLLLFQMVIMVEHLVQWV